MKLSAPSLEQGGWCFVGLPGVELYRLGASQEVAGPRLYVVLQGEIVVDLADGSYEHAKSREVLWINGKHCLQPVGESLILGIGLAANLDLSD